MIPDLTVLWSVFCEVYEELGGPAPAATFVKADPFQVDQFKRIVEGTSGTDQDGSFWHYPAGRVLLQDAVSAELAHVLRTLRNGFSHFRWRYETLSAVDYWNREGWAVANDDPNFNMQNRPAKNYTAYVADAYPWRPASFWQMNDLRILVTPFPILRYHLHVFLNYSLNGRKLDLFDNAL